jgi:hypothetical protein
VCSSASGLTITGRSSEAIVAEDAMSRLRRMQALTHKAHAGQTRNGGRVPYWLHTDGVAAICRDALNRGGQLGDSGEDLVLAAYGHDLYEDTPVGRDLIRREFGDRVDQWIAGMTNERGDNDRAEYMTRLAAAEDEIRIIKCADLTDNMLSVAYGLHDLGVAWARTFFLPIAGETRDVLRATAFRRVPIIGQHMLTLVDWSWARMMASLESAAGHAWSEKGGSVADPEKEPQAGDAELDEWLDRLNITEEQWTAVQERRRREDEERTRKLFGDREPFPIPDTDTDA